MPTIGIAGLVLAAGQSKRMGRPKMTLPWGNTTVIGQVVLTLARAGIPDILVVTGGARREVEKALQGTPARTIFNPDYEQGEMLSTFQLGLAAMGDDVSAVLVTLGDQPQIEQGVVELLVEAFRRTHAPLVVPSFRNRRGHPWLLHRSLWPQALELQHPDTLRDFLHRRASMIHYLPVKTGSVLRDLDTPGDYDSSKPKGS